MQTHILKKLNTWEEIDILETSYTARISELEKQILILENEKCEIEDDLLSYVENGQYIDAVRATTNCDDGSRH